MPIMLQQHHPAQTQSTSSTNVFGDALRLREKTLQIHTNVHYPTLCNPKSQKMSLGIINIRSSFAHNVTIIHLTQTPLVSP